MHGRARVAGHAIHPVLIVFPLGLLSTAVIFDILYLITDRSGFPIAAAYAIAAGVLGGLAAAVFGLIDWLAVPVNTRARRVGALHGLGNVVVLALFAASWLLRSGSQAWDPSVWALLCGFAGFAAAGVTGWLGGELVERHGIGVDEGAHPDSPSSLSDLPADARGAAGHA